LLASNELIINSKRIFQLPSSEAVNAIFTPEMLQEAACELGKIIQKVGVPFIFALKRKEAKQKEIICACMRKK
jgi:hypothetical protein